MLLEVSSFPPLLGLVMPLLPHGGGGTRPLVALLPESCRDFPRREVTLRLTGVVSRMQPAKIRSSVHSVGWRFPGRRLMDAPAQEPLSCPHFVTCAGCNKTLPPWFVSPSHDGSADIPAQVKVRAFQVAQR